MQAKRRGVLRRIAIFIVAGAAITILLLSMRALNERWREAQLVAIEEAVEPDKRLVDLPDIDPTSWVRQYRPEASAGGYNLILYKRRVPMIINMNSRIVWW